MISPNTRFGIWSERDETRSSLKTSHSGHTLIQKIGIHNAFEMGLAVLRHGQEVGRATLYPSAIHLKEDGQHLAISLQMLHHVVEHDLFLFLDQPMAGVQTDALEGPRDEGWHA
jgi:hypothetical protein